MDVDGARFAVALPALRELTTSVDADLLAGDAASGGIDMQAWASSAASALLNRTLNQMPKQVWDEDPAAISDEYRALLTPEAVGAAVSEQLSRVELSVLSPCATLDGRLFNVARVAAARPAGAWRRATPRSFRPEMCFGSITTSAPAETRPSCSSPTSTCPRGSRRLTFTSSSSRSALTTAGTAWTRRSTSGERAGSRRERPISSRTGSKASPFSPRRSTIRL